MEKNDGQIIQWVNGTTKHLITGSWALDIDARCIFWNQQGFFIHGLAVSAGAHFQVNEASILVYPDDMGAVEHAIENLKQHIAVDFCFRIITPAAAIHLIHFTAANEISGTKIIYQGSLEEHLLQPCDSKQEKGFEHATPYYAEQLTETGSWQINLRTQHTVFSANLYHLYDVIPGSLQPSPHTFNRFVHPEDRQLVEKTLLRALELHLPVHLEYRIVTENNETRYIRQVSRIVCNEGGKKFMIGSMQHITVSKNNELLARTAQETLAFNQQVFAEIQQNARATYCLLNLHTRKISYSDNFYKILGLRPAATHPVYEYFLDYVHPEERDLLLDCLQAAFEKHLPPQIRLRLFRTDGKLRYAVLQGKLIRNADKEEVMIVTVKDVTEEHHAEQYTRESEDSHALHKGTVQHIEASAGAGNWLLNMETGKVVFSSQFYQIYGVSALSAINSFDQLEKFVYPDDRSLLNVQLEKSLRERQAADAAFRIITPEGQLRYIRLKTKPVYTKRKQQFLQGVIIDCTTEMLLRQKLENQSRFAELVSNSIPDQIFATDLGHNLVFCNSRFELEQQKKLAEITGRNLFDVLPLLKHAVITKTLNEVLSGKTFHLPAFYSPISGRIKEISALPTRTYDDKISGILFIVHDLSSQLPPVEPVRLAQRMENMLELPAGREH